MNVSRSALRDLPLLAVAALGCGGSAPLTPTGQLSVSWKIGGSTCTKSGLASVEITLSDRSGPVDTQAVSCDLGTYVFQTIPEGIYRVDVEGYPAAAETATYDGAVPELVVRSGGVTATEKISLSQKPGSLDVRWRFEDGDLCFSHQIEVVELVIWDEGGTQVLLQELPCDLSQLPAGPAQSQATGIPDPTAEATINPKGYLVSGLRAGTYVIDVRGKTSTDAPATYWDEMNAVVAQARSSELQLFLDSCQTSPNPNLCGQ